ncbi:hypothetical protein L218DRAFT_587409 [Marasmius fiardii PR-910]|nr:hypothetical protein L218DRAFT_587409 [Marasmius fiardii PR-910]
MEFLTTTWCLLKERPKALVVGSKRHGSKHDPPYPSKMIDADLSPLSLAPTSQWSPVSMTFEQKPHLLMKRGRSLKSSITRRSEYHPVDKNPSLDSLPPQDRKRNLLNVVIVPLTRRKSKTSAHKDASPTSSETSSLSSASSKKHFHSHLNLLRRTASQTSVHRPREYFGQSGPLQPLPPSLVPPVPDLPPGVNMTKPVRKRRATLAGNTGPPRQHPLPKPIIADVEGYWDHLELLNDSRYVHRGRDPPFPVPRRRNPHDGPIPF